MAKRRSHAAELFWNELFTRSTDLSLIAEMLMTLLAVLEKTDLHATLHKIH
jgi:hypothetical protein